MNQPLAVQSVRVDHLFGDRTVEFDLDEQLFENHTRSHWCIYGENGSGKTTLLKIIFHGLSPATASGHRSAIAKIPFHRAQIRLTNGCEVMYYRRHKSLVGSFTLSVVGADGTTVEETFRADSDLKVKKNAPEYDKILKILGEHVPTMYFMSDDRRFSSDAHGTADEQVPDEGMEFRFFDEYGGSWHEAARSRRQRPSPELDIALTRVAARIKQRVFEINEKGQSDALKIYEEVVRSLASFGSSMRSSNEIVENMRHRLQGLKRTSERLSEYGLVSPLPLEFFVQSLRDGDAPRSTMIAQTLTPFVESAEVRFDAMSSVFSMVDALVSSVNDFFTRKNLVYSVRHGFQVISQSSGEPIALESLSSGEKHLLLLLSTAVLAGETDSVFLVDEPELSLNTTWQMQLVPALLACSGASNTQFFLATHSHDIIAGSPDCIIRMP